MVESLYIFLTHASMAAQFTDDNFQDEVVKAGMPVLVDFYADWCGPCKAIAPVIDELAGEYEGKVKIGKMDVDANGETPQQFGVMSIPTMVLFKDGKEVDRLNGAVPKDAIKEKLDALL